VREIVSNTKLKLHFFLGASLENGEEGCPMTRFGRRGGRPRNLPLGSTLRSETALLPHENSEIPEIVDGEKTVRCERSKSRLRKCPFERSVWHRHDDWRDRMM
jgi:hypothetical protein